jgi:anti-sigma-K factor RskA
MNRDEIAELAAGYALGGLDAPDRERFEALLRSGDPDAAAALSDFEATLVDVAQGMAVSPRPELKQAVLARLDAEARPAPVIPLPAPRRPSRWTAVWAGAAAAGIAAVLVGMAVSSSYERRLGDLGQEAAALKSEVERLRGEVEQQRALVALLRDPETQVVALAGQPAAPQARARMLWHRRGGGLLVAADLPALPAGKTYQLWAIAGKAAPVSAGTFAVDPSGRTSLRVAPVAGVDAVDVFAVTVEPEGGLPAPSGPMVLAGKA